MSTSPFLPVLQRGTPPPSIRQKSSVPWGIGSMKQAPSGYKNQHRSPQVKRLKRPEPTEKERVIYAYPLIQPVFGNLPPDL